MLKKGGDAEVAACGTVISASLGVVLLLAGLVEPYMPSITAKVNCMLVSRLLCLCVNSKNNAQLLALNSQRPSSGRLRVFFVQILVQLALPPDSVQLTDEFLQKSASLTTLVPARHHIGGAEVLFKEILPETEEYLRQR